MSPRRKNLILVEQKVLKNDLLIGAEKKLEDKIEKLYEVEPLVEKVLEVLGILVEQKVLTIGHVWVDRAPEYSIQVTLAENLPSPLRVLKGVVKTLRGVIPESSHCVSDTTVTLRSSGSGIWISICFSNSCTIEYINERRVTSKTYDTIVKCGEESFTSEQIKSYLT